jgi:hypothetical protein
MGRTKTSTLIPSTPKSHHKSDFNCSASRTCVVGEFLDHLFRRFENILSRLPGHCLLATFTWQNAFCGSTSTVEWSSEISESQKTERSGEIKCNKYT